MNTPKVIHPRTHQELFTIFEELDRADYSAITALLPPSLTPDIPPASDEAALGVTSSGSTGVPRIVWKEWKALRSQVSRRATDLRAWATPFEPWTFAGVQVALQAWATGASIATLGSDWGKSWEILTANKIDALSCTPTYLHLLLTARHGNWSPRQITLGGEPLRAAVGARFAAAFPHTRFTVVYASAELGVVLKTHRLDGLYETAPLNGEGEWRIQNGELQLRRGGARLLPSQSSECWISTGDAAELHDGGIRVLGRIGSVANVGGAKVSLASVARAAEQVAGVSAAIAVAEPNPITGQIVCLKFVVQHGFSEQHVRTALEAHLRRALPKEAWPRRWESAHLTLGPNAKGTLE